jgi:hypothetical protein
MEFQVLERLNKMTILVPKKTMRQVLPNLDTIVGTKITSTTGICNWVPTRHLNLCPPE